MKKILSILMVLLLVLLTSCETFEEEKERVPNGYTSYTSLEALPIDIKNICKDRVVFIITPGLKENAALSSIVSYYDSTSYYIDSTVDMITKDDVLTETNNGNEVVIILAPGVSSKGLGAAGIDVSSEITRAKEICALNTKKGSFDDKVEIIEVNNEKYVAATDGKSVNMFNELFPYIDLLIISKERNNNIFRTPMVQYNYPVLEISLNDFTKAFDYMFGEE